MRSLQWLVLLCATAISQAQPVLRLKVPIDAIPGTIQAPPAARVHFIVQFYDPPTVETMLALIARGAALLQYVPDNAFLVALDDSVNLSGLGIRYAAPLSPPQKISPLITTPDPIVIRGYYVVEFHVDIDTSRARSVILNSPAQLVENPDLERRHLLVHIADPSREPEILAALASNDSIGYIFPASDDLVMGRPTASLGISPQYISTFGDGWDGPGQNPATLLYYFSHLTAQLPEAIVRSEILRALGEWAKVAQITWLPGASPAGDRTVNVLFATGDHGDGFPFDGVGGVLAHTFYPAPPTAEPLAGDMHFDDAETWHIGSDYDIFSVAVHESGHALGLGSSDNPGSVMYPYYKLRTGLSDDDKASILTLYAAQAGNPVPALLALSVETPPPSTTAATLSLSGTVTGGSGSVTVTWSSNTGMFGTAILNGTGWLASNIPLSIGFNSITVVATDALGSIFRTVGVTRAVGSSLALTVNPPPATTSSATLSLSGTVTSGSGTVAVTWFSSSGASGSASIGGANWLASSIPLIVGSNTITVVATDAAGSVSRVVSTIRTETPLPTRTDTTGPTLTITFPSTTSFATTSPSLTFAGTAADRSGVSSVTWSTNTGGAGTAAGTAQWTAVIPLLAGFNQVIVRAVDSVGNASWRTVVVTRR